MLEKDTTFVLNIICLVYYVYCVLNSILVVLNLFGIFTVISLILSFESNSKIIKNIFNAIFELIIINVQSIF